MATLELNKSPVLRQSRLPVPTHSNALRLKTKLSPAPASSSSSLLSSAPPSCSSPSPARQPVASTGSFPNRPNAKKKAPNHPPRPRSIHGIHKPKPETEAELPSLPRSTTSMTNRSNTRSTRSTTSMTNRTSPSPAPKTPVKSSEAFREMIASARRNAKKAAPPSPATAAQPVDPQLDPSLSIQWGLQPLSNLIQKAQRTGRLNLASRMMDRLPPEIYSQLVPPHSAFHPSNRHPTLSSKPAKAVDLSISHADDQQTLGEVKWYETLDLTYLNVSLNDITALDDEVGGFECLEHCDLHHNQLTTLPTPFGLLVNIVHLNLSSNKLATIPLPILALVNLKELDLSNNSLTTLWHPTWKPSLKQALATVSSSFKPEDPAPGDPSLDDSFTAARTSRGRLSMITSSSVGNEDFSESFPSSPSKGASAQRQLNPAFPDDQTGSQCPDPFPLLQKLWLCANRFSSQSLFGPDAVRLPAGLVELDVSKNPLCGPIDAAGAFLGLDRLTTLKLSGCEFGDLIFRFEVEQEHDQLSSEHNSSSSSSLFPSLGSLDLSHNSIDSLGPLEGFFGQHAPHRALSYVGIPSRLAKLMVGAAPNSQGEQLEVLIADNFLRNEGRRRRAMVSEAVKQPNPHPEDRSEALPPTLQALTIDSDPSSASGAAVSPSSSPPRPVKTDRKNWHLVEAAYAKQSMTLSLANRGLATLSFSDPPPSLSRIRALDISHNQLMALPLPLIHPETLTTLNLSRNKLTTASLALLRPLQLMVLEELDLSSNALTSNNDELFCTLDAATGPKLKKLNVSSNILTSLDGIESLLLGKELASLIMHSNRIDSLRPIEMMARDLRSLKQWSCHELDVSSNNISKLEPVIGRLPLKSFLVSGNLFRVPVRKVYEGSDGTPRLLKWLKERDVTDDTF